MWGEAAVGSNWVMKVKMLFVLFLVTLHIFTVEDGLVYVANLNTSLFLARTI